MQPAVQLIRVSKSFRVRRARGGGMSARARDLFRPLSETVHAIDELSFSIAQGERVAFIGPNGAGKSTTLKVLVGILRPDAGDVRVLGFIPSSERRRLAFHIGTVFGQRSQLWYQLPRDTFELLGRVYEIDRRQHRRRIAMLTTLFELDGLVDTPVRHRSLGERMRCEIVASLLHSPRLAAPESTGGNVSSKSLAFARGLMAANLKATLALRGAFAMQVVFMALNNLTFFVFWWALMGRVPVIRGWQLGDVQLLFGLVAVAFGLTVTVAGGVRHLGRFIEDGDLDTLLTQPRPLLIYALGMRSKPSGIGDILSGSFLIGASGYLSLHSAPFLVIGVNAAAVMFLATGIRFFSLAFWLGKVETIARQLWDLLITFSMYPEPLFGGVLRILLFTILPAGSSAICLWRSCARPRRCRYAC
jgi:ABC-type uncharacterized transport system permease subunit/ABC-type transport system involved in cytochrome c biogenesis ATPase subunit